MPYIGEIRMFGGNFAPAGWMLCQGQTLAISENDTLFNLIGTTYGGDGQSTFQLPDLAGRLPVHMGTLPGGGAYVIGQSAGVETVTLTQQQIPQHNHPVLGSGNAGTVAMPAGNSLGFQPNSTIIWYGTDAPLVPFNSQAITPDGGNQPHENMQPYLCVNFIISLFGVYPSPN